MNFKPDSTDFLYRKNYYDISVLLNNQEMKKILFCSMLIFYTTFLNAQPQWKFHIAFEDATGARDTIFLIWDSTATWEMDTLLGEIPMNFDTNIFQVYMYINSTPLDSSKVSASNTNYSIYQSIYAKNYVYPIKISWDTSLFHSSVLPIPVDCAEMYNEYFFLTSGDICQTFNMFTNDSVIAPSFLWGSQDHFPIAIRIINDGQCCLNSIEENFHKQQEYILWPNPVKNDLTVKCFNNIINDINIYTIEGRKISYDQKIMNQANEIHLSTALLLPGMYIMEIINNLNERKHEMFIKN